MSETTKTKRGRKAKYGERKVTMSVRVTPTVQDYLRGQALSASDCVEEAVRATAGFRAIMVPRKKKAARKKRKSTQ